MFRFQIKYIEKNTYAEGLEQSVKRFDESEESALENFKRENMGIVDKVVSIEKVALY